MIHINDLIVRYVSAWNETDSGRRRVAIAPNSAARHRVCASFH